MLLDFANVTGSHSADEIRNVWGRYYEDLSGARGIFVVDDPKHELQVPGDRDFDAKGFLRCLMGGRRLLNIQNLEGARECRYSAPIFCDTNFVSFCGACFAGRDLKANNKAFRQAVEYLLPRKESLNATAYVIENAGNPNLETLRTSLVGFLALKRSTTPNFGKHLFNDKQTGDLQNAVNRVLETLKGPDFQTIHAWVKERYAWSKLILLKATLIAFTDAGRSIENRMRQLFQFLHDEFARFIQFEIYVAFSILFTEFAGTVLQRNPTERISPRVNAEVDGLGSNSLEHDFRHDHDALWACGKHSVSRSTLSVI